MLKISLAFFEVERPQPINKTVAEISEILSMDARTTSGASVATAFKIRSSLASSTYPAPTFKAETDYK